MNKYLFVVRGYAPEISASGNLIKPLLEELSKEHIIHVLCTTANFSVTEVVNGITIHRVNIDSRVSFLKKTLNLIWRNLFFGFRKLDVIGSVRNKLELLDEDENYTKIVSVTYEETLSLVQSNISPDKKCAFVLEKLPETSRFFLIKFFQKQINYYFFNKIQAKIDYCFVLPIVFNALKKRNLLWDKVVCLEHPMILNKVVDYKVVNSKRTDIFNLLYAGGIDKYQRNPDPIIKFFNSMKNILNVSFYSYGNLVNEFKKRELFNCVFYDVVSVDELANLYETTDFIITIGNKEKDIFPSKLFDCISTGIPIIHFSQHSDDPYYEYLGRYKYSLILSYSQLDEPNSRLKFLSFLNEMKDKRASFSDIKASFYDCTPEYNARKLLFYIAPQNS